MICFKNILVLVGLTLQSVHAENPELTPFLSMNDVEYFISNEPVDADLAFRTCEDAGYKLLSIRDHEENANLKKKLFGLAGINLVWTSGHKVQKNSSNPTVEYIWSSTSVPVKYSDFYETQIRSQRLIRNRRESENPEKIVTSVRCGGGSTPGCSNAPQCNITVKPCETITKPCDVICPNCTVHRSEACSVVCPPCEVLQLPECEVLPPVCTATIKPCTVEPPKCTVSTGPCTTTRGNCTTVQKPCRKRTRNIIPCPSAPKCKVNQGPLCTTVQPPCVVAPQPCVTITPACSNDEVDGQGGNASYKCPPPTTTCPPALVTCPPEQTTCRPPIDCTPVICMSPALICDAAETHCPPPVTVCPLPEIVCEQPTISCPQEPEVICGEPEVQCSKPLVKCGSPEVSCPGPVTSCTQAQHVCPPPEVYCPDPEVICEDPVPCDPTGTFSPLTDPTCPPEEPTTEIPCDDEECQTEWGSTEEESENLRTVGCVGMQRKVDFKWDVERCDAQRHFICELVHESDEFMDFY